PSSAFVYLSTTLPLSLVRSSFSSSSRPPPRPTLFPYTTLFREAAGGWTPDEILDVDRSLEAYSATVAHQAHADRSPAPWGEITLGASADLIVFAQDPRDLTPRELALASVRSTYLRGVAVHTSD